MPGSRHRRLPRRELARALRLGLGRARIDVRRHGLAGREDVLVATSLRGATFDVQMDGELSGWLLDVARDGGAVDRVRRAVLAAAARPIARRDDRSQVAAFLGILDAYAGVRRIAREARR